MSSPMRATSAGASRAAAEAGREVLALDEVHDEVRLVAVRAGVQARDDVRVAQDRGGQRLASEALARSGSALTSGRRSLTATARSAGVERPVDGGHPAAPDDPARR